MEGHRHKVASFVEEIHCTVVLLKNIWGGGGGGGGAGV